MPEPKVILAAARQHYRDVESVEFFRDSGSLAYVVSGAGRKHFLRVIKPAFLDVALRSVDILTYLSANDIPVPRIVPTKEGLSSVKLDLDDEEHLCVLYEYLEGGEPEPQDMEAVGAAVGRMHRVMKGYNGPLETRDKHFFIGRYLDILEKKKYPSVDAFREYGDAVWEKVRGLPRGFCHGDLYKGNVLKTTDDTVYILDFDTACNALPVYDIALFCNETDYFHFAEDGYDKTRRSVERFLRGYRRHSAISDEEIASIFDLLAIYHFQVQATVIEIFGLDCVDEAFLDEQLDWLMRWREQCERETVTHNAGS